MRTVSAFAFIFSATLAWAAEPKPETKLAVYFTPPECNVAALSPDGKFVIVARREPKRATAVVINVDHPDDKNTFLLNQQDPMRRSDIYLPPKVTALRWMNATRVIVESDSTWLLAVDRDGQHPQHLVNPNDPQWRVADDLNINVPTDRLTASLGLPGAALDISLARTARMIGARPEEPDCVYVVGSGLVLRSGQYSVENHALFKISASTGKTELLHEEEVQGQFGYDAQCNLRLKHTENETPQRYYLREATAKAAWRSLDEVTAPSGAQQFHVSPEDYFGHRSIPLGFGDDPQILYFASNLDRDTYGVYALDVRSGRRTDFKLEDPMFDLVSPRSVLLEGPLVFDRGSGRLLGLRYAKLRPTAAWLDPQLQQLQTALEQKFPTEIADIAEWDEGHQRFLIKISAHTNPGFFAIASADGKQLTTIAVCSEHAQEFAPARTVPWHLKDRAGRDVSGLLTVPLRRAAAKLPLIVFESAYLWSRPSSRYDARVAALTAMGYAVLEVNHRGTAGLGLAHWTAARTEVDTAPLDDIISAIDGLAEQAKLDPERVAMIGEDLGGYLALRAVELHPDRFSCAIAIDTPVDVAEWLKPPEAKGPSSQFRRQVVRQFWGEHPDELRARAIHGATQPYRPVMLVTSSVSSNTNLAPMKALRSKLSKEGHPPEYLDAGRSLLFGSPDDKAAVFASMQKFLAASLNPPGAAVH